MKSSTRNRLAIGACAVLLPFAVATADAATITPSESDRSAFATSIDRAIDLSVAQRVALQKLTPAQALVAREQMQIQFSTLSKEAKDKIIALVRDMRTEESAAALATALQNAVTDEARQALVDAQGKLDAQASQAHPAPKLGGDGDLVFVATVGPCRVWDSRFGMGALGAFSATQVYAYSSFAGYLWSTGDSQGGTGTAGSGNCAGTVYPGVVPVSVVATVAVTNTGSNGSLRAWNGGTTLTVGGIVGWIAGETISNTTVIPMNRSITPYPGSGFKRDLGLYNNSPTAIDTIVDVVGYFIVNQATALDCTTVYGTNTNIPANSSTLLANPACTTGYAAVGTSANLQNGLYISTNDVNTGCRLGNLTGGGLLGSCNTVCCRVPGR
jgi:hypothetical protein